MKMRTVRTAGLIGGLATGALLLAGTAAQAADATAEESAGDLVQATPEALGGLPVSPDAVTGAVSGVTSKVPGLGAVDSIPGLNGLVPSGSGSESVAATEAKADKPADLVDTNRGQDTPASDPLGGLPLDDLLGGLGGGLPVPLPF